MRGGERFLTLTGEARVPEEILHRSKVQARADTGLGEGVTAGESFDCVSRINQRFNEPVAEPPS